MPIWFTEFQEIDEGMEGKYGKYIKVNSTGIRRRRPGLLHGSKMAPQGRPAKMRSMLPARHKTKPKRPHSLSNSILHNIPAAH